MARKIASIGLIVLLSWVAFWALSPGKNAYVDSSAQCIKATLTQEQMKELFAVLMEQQDREADEMEGAQE